MLACRIDDDGSPREPRGPPPTASQLVGRSLAVWHRRRPALARWASTRGGAPSAPRSRSVGIDSRRGTVGAPLSLGGHRLAVLSRGGAPLLRGGHRLACC